MFKMNYLQNYIGYYFGFLNLLFIFVIYLVKQQNKHLLELKKRIEDINPKYEKLEKKLQFLESNLRKKTQQIINLQKLLKQNYLNNDIEQNDIDGK